MCFITFLHIFIHVLVSWCICVCSEHEAITRLFHAMKFLTNERWGLDTTNQSAFSYHALTSCLWKNVHVNSSRVLNDYIQSITHIYSVWLAVRCYCIESHINDVRICFIKHTISCCLCTAFLAVFVVVYRRTYVWISICLLWRCARRDIFGIFIAKPFWCVLLLVIQFWISSTIHGKVLVYNLMIFAKVC